MINSDIILNNGLYIGNKQFVIKDDTKFNQTYKRSII